MVVYHGTRSPRDFSKFETGSIFNKKGDLLIAGSRDPGAYLGPHFAEDPKLASKFASGSAQEWDRKRVVETRKGTAAGRVVPVYLRILNPFVFDSDEDMIEFIFEHGHSPTLDDELETMAENEDDPDEWEPTLEDKQHAIHMLGTYDSDSDMAEAAAEELGSSVKHLLERRGFDGVIYVNTIEGHGLSLIPFEAHQIKSASGNRGTWSLHRRDIRE